MVDTDYKYFRDFEDTLTSLVLPTCFYNLASEKTLSNAFDKECNFGHKKTA